MIQYMSAKEAAEKWNISHRRVSILCAENRIPNVAMLGNMWLIPRNAEKPVDARFKNAAPKDAAHPFVKWAGGKGQLIEVLKSNLPDMSEISKYAEPMVGGGALLFALLGEYAFKEVYINDNNKELINAFKVIRDNHYSLIEKLNNIQTEYSALEEAGRHEYYYRMRDIFNDTPLESNTAVIKAALFIFLNRTCFNGLYRVNRAGKFNVPAGKYKNPLICDGKNLTKISTLLKNVIIKSCDYHNVESFADSSTLLYFDPPYRPLHKGSFTSYTEEQFDDGEQIKLAEFYKALCRKGAKVMLSNSDPWNADYEDSFFDDLYGEFNIQRITAARSINSKSSGRGDVTELIIKNY